MSGGHFEYKCFQIRDFADMLEADMADNSEEFSLPVMEKLKECHELIEKAAKVAREVEWLYSGDSGEASFLNSIEGILSNEE